MPGAQSMRPPQVGFTFEGEHFFKRNDEIEIDNKIEACQRTKLADKADQQVRPTRNKVSLCGDSLLKALKAERS